MKDHTVIVADSRGHGRSSRNADAYSYELMASDYLALLDYLKVDKVALVGWSDGGIIGIDIAMKHPERLTRLFAHAANVTIDGARPEGDGKQDLQRLYRARWARTIRSCPRRPTSSTPSSSRSATCGRPSRHGRDAELAKITVPTAIVLGDHDEAITRAHTDHMADGDPRRRSW